MRTVRAVSQSLAVIIPLALFPRCVLTQQGTSAPVSAILTWIGSHFEVADYDDAGSPSEHVQESFSSDFQGCSATLTDRKVFTVANGSQRDTIATEIYGPFNLSGLIPSKITTHTAGVSTNVSSRRFVLEIGSAHPIPTRTASSDGEHPSPGTWPNVTIIFATQDMANRQAKAWHDAIVACGGKAVPNNLY